MVLQAKQMISCRIASCWTVIIFAHFITRVCLLGVTFGDNNYARSLTSLRLDAADASSELPAIQNNMFQICDGVPGHGRATCQITSTNSSFEHQPRSCEFRPISFRHNVTISVDGGEKVVGGKCIAAMQHFHDVLVPRLFRDCCPNLTSDDLDSEMPLQKTSRLCPFSYGFLRYLSIR